MRAFPARLGNPHVGWTGQQRCPSLSIGRQTTTYGSHPRGPSQSNGSDGSTSNETPLMLAMMIEVRRGGQSSTAWIRISEGRTRREALSVTCVVRLTFADPISRYWATFTSVFWPIYGVKTWPTYGVMNTTVIATKDFPPCLGSSRIYDLKFPHSRTDILPK